MERDVVKFFAGLFACVIVFDIATHAAPETPLVAGIAKGLTDLVQALTGQKTS
jgi:hypothetical protein